jgi:hypothetical protein
MASQMRPLSRGAGYKVHWPPTSFLILFSGVISEQNQQPFLLLNIQLLSFTSLLSPWLDLLQFIIFSKRVFAGFYPIHDLFQRRNHLNLATMSSVRSALKCLLVLAPALSIAAPTGILVRQDAPPAAPAGGLSDVDILNL